MEKKDFKFLYDLLKKMESLGVVKKRKIFKGNEYENVWGFAKENGIILKNEKNLFFVSEKGLFFLDFLKRREDIQENLTHKNYDAIEKIYYFQKKERPDLKLDKTILKLRSNKNIKQTLLSWDEDKKDWNIFWKIPLVKKIDLTKHTLKKSDKSLYGEFGVPIYYKQGEVFKNEDYEDFVKVLENKKSKVDWFFSNDALDKKHTFFVKGEDEENTEKPDFIFNFKKCGISLAKINNEMERKTYKVIDDYIVARRFDKHFCDFWFHVKTNGNDVFVLKDKDRKVFKSKKLKYLKIKKSKGVIYLFFAIVILGLVVYYLDKAGELEWL